MALCAGVASFYLLFPRFFVMRKFWKLFVEFFGLASMCFAALLFTSHHDLVLNIAGTLGGIALFGTLTALRNQHFYRLLWVGAFCMLLLAINSYIYFTRVLVEYLPVIQKITLLVFPLWMMAVSRQFKQQIEPDSLAKVTESSAFAK
jgi:hypothetical protein